MMEIYAGELILPEHNNDLNTDVTVLKSTPVNLNTASATDNTTSATYVSMSAPSSVSMTKISATTQLRVFMAITLYSATALSGVMFGVLIDGTDYDVAGMYLDIHSTRMLAVGETFIPGLAAGAYTVQGRWYRSAGAGIPTRIVSDRIVITVQEIPG